MLVMTSDEKNMDTKIQPPEIIRPQPQQQLPPKRARMRKYVIIGVTTVAVLVALIVAGLVGVKLYLDSASEMVERSFEFADSNDRKIQQNTTTSTADNIVRYHLKDNGNEVWVIDDFNRNIEILKTTASSGFACYVTPINGTDVSMPEAIKNATSPTGAVDRMNKRFSPSLKPITDTSILGTNGQTLCEGLDVYWLIPSCEALDSGTAGSRKKRSSCDVCYTCYYRYYCDDYYCYWRYLCYYYCC